MKSLTLLPILILTLTLCPLAACDSGGGETGNGSGTIEGDGGATVETDAMSGEADGAGGAGPDVPDTPPEPTCHPAAEVEGMGITGLLYLDENDSDISNENMGFEEGVDTPLGGETVKLLTWGGVEWSATTCEGGDYGFGNLPDGVYLIEPELDDTICRSRNCPRQVGEAVRSGTIKVVTMGDSVPVVGDKPTFPDRLAALLGGLATVDNTNIAVGGTTSNHWLPGTSYCQNYLLPEVEDADVLVISLGGNDILEYVNGAFSGGGLGGDLVEGAMELVVKIVDNVLSTVEAARAVNPDLDVVYCLYPNYGEAESTMPWSVVGGFLGAETMIELLDTARGAIPFDSGLILADMYAGFAGLPLDDYLYDSLHFNHAGATLYAEIIFQALGGVYIGESPLPPHGASPLGSVHSFGVSP